MNYKTYNIAEDFTDDLYGKIAKLQRDKPEEAMNKIQHSQIAPLYGFVAEHGGDIYHRMNQHYKYTKGTSGIPKIQKVLRSLEDRYGFEKEVKEQILEYSQRNNETVENTTTRLKTLSQSYADEHRKLPVYNQGQKLARGIAIAIGEWRFSDAIVALKELKQQIETETWEAVIT